MVGCLGLDASSLLGRTSHIEIEWSTLTGVRLTSTVRRRIPALFQPSYQAISTGMRRAAETRGRSLQADGNPYSDAC